MRILSKLKLRSQLYLLIILFTLIMVIVQAFYFIKFNHLTNERGDIYFESMAKQVEGVLEESHSFTKKVSAYINFHDNVQRYILEEDPITRYNISQNLISTLDTKAWLKEELTTILVMDNKDRVLSSTPADLYYVFYRLNQDYSLKTAELRESFYSKQYYDEGSRMYYYAYVNPIFNKYRYMNHSPGKSVIIFHTEPIQKFIEDLPVPEGSKLMVIDQDGTILACNQNKYRGTVYNSSGLSNYDEKNTYHYNSTIDELNWQVVFLIPRREFDDEMLPIVYRGIILTLVFTCIMFLFGFRIIHNIAGPISRIVAQLANVGETNITYRLTREDHNEVGSIVNDINGMLERLEKMTRKIFNTQDQLYSLELDKKQAELSALQSQINPHFLYNTLECIRSIGSYHGITEIQQISSSMAKIFRYAIKKEDTVTINDELQCIQDYIRIMNIRFMDKFTLRLHIEKDIKNHHMIKMILQPVVENAIYHGLEHILGEGYLDISGYYDDNKKNIILDVKDNGKGISEKQLHGLKSQLEEAPHLTKPDNTRRSIGLLNIHNRLRLSYGLGYGITIDSSENIGTTISIRIPAL